MTGATYFGGGALCDEGMQAAGIKTVFSIEYDDATASVARDNGHNSITADVCAVDPATLSAVDCFHFSPPCPEFSQAKTGGAERELDKDMARAALRYIYQHRPKFVTMENVYGYRKSYSALIIEYTLRELGYGVEAWHLNAANFGVPQTRKRLIMVAVLNAERGIHPPKMTHQKRPGMFTKPWNGWFASIEDLLPSCPDSQLAAWQQKRMSPEIRTLLVGAGGFDGGVVSARPHEPAFTVTANSNQGHQVRAVLVKNGDAWCPLAVREEPSPTVSATNGFRGVLVSSHSIDGGEAALREAHAPSVSLGTNAANMRAVLVSQDYAQSSASETRAPQSFHEGEPAPSVRASAANAGHLRAILVDTAHAGRSATVRLGEGSSPSVQAWHGRRPSHAPVAVLIQGENSKQQWGRGYKEGDGSSPSLTTGARPRAVIITDPTVRVVQLTVPCLARFQSVRDDYKWPDSKTLACKIVGNGLPSLLAQRVYESLLR